MCALHILKGEDTINNQKIALVTFLYVQRRNNNISFKLMRAASNRGVENNICKRIKGMLEGRLIKPSLAGETMQASVRREYTREEFCCPFYGTLSLASCL